MDRGAWRAPVYGVAKSRTRLIKVNSQAFQPERKLGGKFAFNTRKHQSLILVFLSSCRFCHSMLQEFEEDCALWFGTQ